MKRSHWPAWMVVACWLAPLLLFASRYYERPEMLTYLWLAATLAVIYHAGRRPRLLWLLPLIQICWVNSQGLFILQFVVLGCYGANRALRLFWIWGADPREQAVAWPQLLAVGALCLAAAFINPYGVRGALFPWILFQRVEGPQREFFHMFSDELKGMEQLLAEGGPAVLSSLPNSSLILVLLAGLVTSLMLLLRWRRLSVYRILLLLAVAYLSWQMQRNRILAAIAGGAVICWNVGQLYDLWRAAGEHIRRAEGLPAAPYRRGEQSFWLAQLLLAACLLLILVSLPTNIYATWLRPTNPPRNFGFAPYFENAHDAAQFLSRPGMPKYLYACDLRQAAVCIFHLTPERRVFADARLETNRPETLWNYLVVQDQLLAHDPRVAETLMYNLPSGERQLPALLFGTPYLIENPEVLEALLHHPLFRCVYVDRQGSGMVFLSVSQAEQLRLPPVETQSWQQLADYQRERKRLEAAERRRSR